MILLDTSGLLAALFPDQPRHQEAAEALRQAGGPLLLSPFILAELDYLIARVGGVEKELLFLQEVAREAYRLVDFSPGDVELARRVIERYADHDIGLADASLAVLADRVGCTDLLTLDERHFRVVRLLGGGSFRLLPADLH